MPPHEFNNSFPMVDDDYRRMRQAEDPDYESPASDEEPAPPPDEDDEDAAYDAGYPEEPVADNPGPHYSDRYDFVVLLPRKIIRIAQDSHLSWLTMFYGLPRELVEKRPAYLELPRHVGEIVNSERFTAMIHDDAFLELVWDCYAWAIWQALKVPDGKGGYREIPGNWQNYSGDFPLWRMCYDILRYFRMTFEYEMDWSFQKLFCAPPGVDVPWLTWQHFSNLVFNLTDRIVEQQKLQPVIDAVWEHRLPEDYDGSGIKRQEFMRAWQHSRNHPHLSAEQMAEGGFELEDPQLSVEEHVLSQRQTEQFMATLTEKDKRILELRMQGHTMQEIADAVGYSTPSAVKKRIDRIAAQYEDFVNPLPEDGERPVGNNPLD